MSIKKHAETKTYTQYVEVTDSVTCDLCGRTETRVESEDDGINWSPPTGHEHWRVEKQIVTVMHKHVVATRGDYGSTTVEIKSLDVCLDCIHTKVFALAPDKVRHIKSED